MKLLLDQGLPRSTVAHFDSSASDLVVGAAVSVTEQRVRVHLIPIGK